MIVFLIGGQIENQLLSTGAFEVYLNGKCTHELVHSIVKLCLFLYIDVQVWSKLESGRLPSVIEMKELIVEPQSQFDSASTSVDPS